MQGLLTCGHILLSWCDLLCSCFFFFYLFKKNSRRERERENRSTRSSPFPTAPHHLCGSTNFHLKHVELILPLHGDSPHHFFGGTSNTPRLQSGGTKQQNILVSVPPLRPQIPLADGFVRVSVFPPLSFLSYAFISSV